MMADENREYYQSSERNVFPLKTKETYYYTYLQDFGSSNIDMNINFKQFLSFFRIWDSLDFLK